MRKFNLFLGALLFISNAYCQVGTYDFNWIGIGTPTCNAFVTQKNSIEQQVSLGGGFESWNVSHGAPSLTGTQGNFNKSMLETSYDNVLNTFKSEGLYLKSVFSECYYYDIIITLRRTSGYIGLSVYAANQLTERTTTSCILETVPTISETNKELIISTANAPQPDYNAYGTITASNFLSHKNSNYLWLYSTSDVYCGNNLTGSLNIIDIWVTKKGYETEPPSVPGNLSLTKAQNGFTAGWSTSNDNVWVAGYQVYVNDVLVGTTTSTSYFYYVPPTANQVYSVKVRAKDPVNNYSDFSSISQIYISPQIEIVGNPQLLCNNAATNISTTNYSNATYSWNSNVGLTLNNTTNPVVSVTANSTYSGYATITLTRIMTLSGLTDTRKVDVTFWIGVPETPTYISPFTGGGYVVGGNTEYSVSTSCSGGYSFDWSVAGGTIISGQGQNDAVLQTVPCSQYSTIPFNISVSAQNTCGSTPYFSEYGTIPIGSPDDPGNTTSRRYYKTIRDISVYPNPCNGVVNVELPLTSNKEVIYEIKVFDIQGKLLLTKSSIKGNVKQSINLSNFNNGNYILTIMNSEGLVEKQIVNLSK